MVDGALREFIAATKCTVKSKQGFQAAAQLDEVVPLVPPPCFMRHTLKDTYGDNMYDSLAADDCCYMQVVMVLFF